MHVTPVPPAAPDPGWHVQSAVWQCPASVRYRRLASALQGQPLVPIVFLSGVRWPLTLSLQGPPGSRWWTCRVRNQQPRTIPSSTDLPMAPGAAFPPGRWLRSVGLWQSLLPVPSRAVTPESPWRLHPLISHRRVHFHRALSVLQPRQIREPGVLASAGVPPRGCAPRNSLTRPA